MIIKSIDDITPKVLSVVAQTTDPRLREIMTSLVTHLHGFVRDVKLTEEEFRSATALLIEIGQSCNDKHNEMVLMAGSLGVSPLVCLQNNEIDTSQNLLGPFWRMNSPQTENGDTIIRSQTDGDPLFVTMQVLDPENNPLQNAKVDIWHCSSVGLYENQDETQADMNLRGCFTTDHEGKIWFSTIKPVGYPIPTNGVVGRLLKAQNRHPMRPAHIHALIYKEGFKTVISQVYADYDENLETDVQFGVTANLIGAFKKVAEGFTLDYTFKMEKGEAKLPKAPIK